ncbi:MAG: hypothetical protein ACOH2H_21325 [Cypionkella sp.]
MTISLLPRGIGCRTIAAPPDTMFIHKILGATTKDGMQLDDLRALGQAVRSRTVTLAAALSPRGLATDRPGDVRTAR